MARQQRKRGPYRITEEDRADRRRRMAKINAEKIDRMDRGEVEALIEEQMAQLPSDVRDSVMAEYKRPLSAPQGEVDGEADAVTHVQAGVDSEQRSEPAITPDSPAAFAPHSANTEDTDLERALAILARNMNRQAQVHRQREGERANGEAAEPDLDLSDDAQATRAFLGPRSPEPHSRPHGTYVALQRLRRSL
jgi:hypothetical protein